MELGHVAARHLQSLRQPQDARLEIRMLSHLAPSSSVEPKASLASYSRELPADLLWVATRVPDKLICSSCRYIFYLPCYLIDPGCAWSCKEAFLDLAAHAIYPAWTPVF